MRQRYGEIYADMPYAAICATYTRVVCCRCDAVYARRDVYAPRYAYAAATLPVTMLRFDMLATLPPSRLIASRCLLMFIAAAAFHY